ncbi:PEP-CTERM sorting domain-containing protein [Roseateles oligotrophus]|uniref:PEP-CTERM sorting domain-containing protein n=1 Tax=Roseateles oligotrophus TaxID=1769250 RepID=A0ABT2YII6_9BURK|nr:PEP-CTERM sorting domain-containing protein [Roseateles oligotrophus]MCV2369822.1 PEP-CTERM sorting domain-containing protein [Roseateles oligotrophus]
MKMLTNGAQLLGAMALTFVTLMPAQASVTYTYKAPITYWANSWGSANWAHYGGLDGSGIEFEFTVAGPLINAGCGAGPVHVGCNANLLPDVLSWKYHGGSAFMNTGSALGGHLTGLALSTGNSGEVTMARFYLDGAVVIPTLEPYTSTLTEAFDGYDQQLLASNYLRQYSTGIHSEPLYASLSEGFSNMRGAGSWRVTSGASGGGNNIPEPTSLLLVLAGIGMIGATNGQKVRCKSGQAR